VRADQAGGLRPTFIADYLRIHGAPGSVTVSPGTWNTGAHNGAGFVHWPGSAAQRAALQPVDHVTRAVHAARSAGSEHRQLEEALSRVLRAETS
jgi:hypothetical protein